MALSNSNHFANNPLDRAAHRRSDPAWLEAALGDPGSLLVPFWRGQPFISSLRPVWLRPGLLPLSGAGQTAVFLGCKDACAHFALELDGEADWQEDGPLAGLGAFQDLRALAARPDMPAGPELAILAQARALFEWHRAHPFCARCGAPSRLAEAGYKRVCEACEAEHFPRTDPVVIMLAICGDQAFLGRQKTWPPGMVSALAGFVEPGETIEEAAARELWEEARIRATAVRYHATQPWPFPASLMIGCLAQAADLSFTPDGKEIETGRWFSRAELAGMIAAPGRGAFRLPPPMAIAHQLVKHFAAP